MGDSPNESRPQQLPIRALLMYVAYCAALIAAAVSIYGPGGIVPAAIIAFAWSSVFQSKNRPRMFLIVSGLGFLLCCVPLMLPKVQGAREAARRTQCRNNLKQIGVALYNYHDVFDSFPPAYTVDETGRPLHSWRVLILPYIDSSILYPRFDLSEPWDSEKNLPLLNEMPDLFACPSSTDGHVKEETSTHYVAVVGEGTAWPGVGGSRIGDFKDGTTNTVLVIECDSGIPWTEPRDLELDEALVTLSSLDAETALGHSHETFFFEEFYGRHVLLGDGSVDFLTHGIDRRFWRGILSIDDEFGLDWERSERREVTGQRKLRIDRCVKFAVFVLIALFPLPWVWLNPRSEYGRGGTMTDDISAG
ncbi:MAG: DUF1559 domain-containing protein [Planctomycetota bacterium]|nr:MAG: DUF1559 domain-containing protein [Planctomycetota bacterium]REJ85908.1 MAG: DUF1559 domain-containing protein [Planctomycetota bacterium]REK27229.1 MAG: DUF1559 domain-containing protein [Planctomycetota bacterium]REK36749.1 MAG: DUF1559 domain-containing protein [Planctomycetota bacterium]